MDIPGLLKSLNENRVKYLIIGATAFPIHGYARVTLDIDIFIEPTRENAEKTMRALREFGYDTRDLTLEEMLQKKALFRGYIVEADIHPFVTGIKTFDEVWSQRVKGEIAGVPVYFANLESLIKMKEAAGRSKDLEDLKFLRELKKKKSAN